MFTFIETTAFGKALPYYLDDDEYEELQDFMINYPEAGDIITGSGGVRKLRWKRPGMGKRSGVRVIYYLKSRHFEIWLLAIYAKSEQEDVPAHITRAWKESIEDE
jgi:hypothetical protein